MLGAEIFGTDARSEWEGKILDLKGVRPSRLFRKFTESNAEGGMACHENSQWGELRGRA